MPNTTCSCGHRIWFGEIPCPYEWLMISDTRYDDYQETVDAEALYGEMTHALKCPSCQRLLIFWEGFEQPPTIYTAE